MYVKTDKPPFSFRSSKEQLHALYDSDLANQLSPVKMQTELYKLVTEITHDALWEWDLRNNELFWIDGGHLRLFGYKIENAIVSQSFWEACVHPDDLGRLLSGLKKVVNQGATKLWEDHYRFKKSNGDYAYVHDRGHIIYDETESSIRMIGATQDITERILLEIKLVEERRIKQKEVTAAVLTAQENERATIGMELHDNLNQVLAVAAMYLQMAKKNESKKDLYLEESKMLITTVISKIRAISKSLVIPGTHIIGLFENIKNLIHDLMEVNPVKIEFFVSGLSENEIDEKLQLNIFRIIQEQMNNIFKHADASHAYITLRKEPYCIVLVISDDGKGCEVLKDQDGVGIINIQSRADLYDGSVTIISKPGNGYELKVVLPVRDHPTDHLDPGSPNF